MPRTFACSSRASSVIRALRFARPQWTSHLVGAPDPRILLTPGAGLAAPSGRAATWRGRRPLVVLALALPPAALARALGERGAGHALGRPRVVSAHHLGSGPRDSRGGLSRTCHGKGSFRRPNRTSAFYLGSRANGTFAYVSAFSRRGDRVGSTPAREPARRRFRALDCRGDTASSHAIPRNAGRSREFWHVLPGFTVRVAKTPEPQPTAEKAEPQQLLGFSEWS